MVEGRKRVLKPEFTVHWARFTLHERGQLIPANAELKGLVIRERGACVANATGEKLTTTRMRALGREREEYFNEYSANAGPRPRSRWIEYLQQKIAVDSGFHLRKKRFHLDSRKSFGVQWKQTKYATLLNSTLWTQWERRILNSRSRWPGNQKVTTKLVKTLKTQTENEAPKNSNKTHSRHRIASRNQRYSQNSNPSFGTSNVDHSQLFSKFHNFSNLGPQFFISTPNSTP